MTQPISTPPVCSYEGSDYQQSFWEKGNRAYEDAVEAIALRRLLPKVGNLLLELGAGAGRNTPRYRGYQRVVLLDYSHTQLEQARDRLGLHSHYVYVSADIYQLPFVSGLFDGATMIRTLHHMADPELALSNVRRVLAHDASFILEFANKRNIKSVFRYLLRRQDWDPFDRAPVEFVELNYDFHPTAIRNWLRKLDFQIEQQLSVSHFRAEFLKKHIPNKLLVFADSLLQWTGSFVQYSPSVFTRSRLSGTSPLPIKDTFFQCPVCHHALPESQEDLHCPGCGKVWAYQDGIYDFRS